MTDEPRRVRYIFATIAPCPKPDCESERSKRSGRSRGGRKRWRVCIKCGHVFIVQPIAEEIAPAKAGESSRLRVL